MALYRVLLLNADPQTTAEHNLCWTSLDGGEEEWGVGAGGAVDIEEVSSEERRRRLYVELGVFSPDGQPPLIGGEVGGGGRRVRQKWAVEDLEDHEVREAIDRRGQ